MLLTDDPTLRPRVKGWLAAIGVPQVEKLTAVSAVPRIGPNSAPAASVETDPGTSSTVSSAYSATNSSGPSGPAPETSC